MRRQMNGQELDELYRGVGRCIWHLQYLEDVLHTLLALKVDIRTPGRVSPEEATNLLTKQRRSPLGTALGTAEKNAALPADLLGELRLLKEERDWLVHRSMNQDGDSLYTDEGREAVFMRLEALVQFAISLKHRVLAHAEAFTRGHGVSGEQVESIARQQIAKLSGDA